MSKVVLSGYYGFDNFGDEAILQVLVNNLKNIGADITVISHNPQKTSFTHDVKSVFTFDIFGILNCLSKTDVLISGGGSLLQDVTSIRSLFYYLFIIFFSILFSKRVIIFSQVIGPIKNKIAKKFTINLLKKASLITVRDERSKNLLTEWGIESQIVNDPVWGIKLKTLRPKGKIGIQLRDWKYMNDEFFLNLVKKVAKEFEDKEIYIYSLQDKQDKEICIRFETYLHMENPKVNTHVFYSMSISDLINSMQDLEYLIAMRYHAIMIGVKYGIKTLAINYDPKVETLSKYAQIPYINFDEYDKIGEYIEKTKLISRRSILFQASKKQFSFEIFEKEINKY